MLYHAMLADAHRAKMAMATYVRSRDAGAKDLRFILRFRNIVQLVAPLAI